MPRFLGLFSRKSKNTDPTPQSSTASDALSSASLSPTASSSPSHDRSSSSSSPRKLQRHPDSTRSKHAPSTPAQQDHSSVYPSITNSPSATSTASSSKLRLPFTRKRQPSVAAAASTTSVNTTESQSVAHRDIHSAHRPSFVDRERISIASDGDLPDSRRLRPPPSKSAIFAAYADPLGTLSTRSLPNEAPQPFSLPDSGMPSPPSDSSPQPPEPPATKKSFFSWGKSVSPTHVAKTKTKPTPPPSQPVQDSKTGSTADLSFNLKSFRHVGPSSALDSQASLAIPNSSPSPSPRPRGTSMGDSSQRISVAAFREAQARRTSMIFDSPNPELRSSSPFGTPPTPQEPGGRASPRLSPLKSSKSHDTRLDGTKNRGFESDSDADTSSEEDSDNESDHERTLTQRDRWKGKAKAKSEVGHGAPRSENTDRRLDDSSRSPSGLGNHVARPRASMSTSAATPSAAAQRASILVNANDPAVDHKRNTRHNREPSFCSNPGASTTSSFSPSSAPRHLSSSDSEDEEDAPLAIFVQPKRPGSALSAGSGSSPGSQITSRNRSNSNIPGRGKPLIDINELLSAKISMAEDKGFTQGNTLLASASPPGTRNPASIKTSRLSASPPPLSPTESFNSSGFATAPSSIRAFSQMSPVTSNSEQAAHKRDRLNERLLRATKGSVARAASPVPISSSIGNVNASSNPDGARQSAVPQTSFGTSQNPGFHPSHPAEPLGFKMVGSEQGQPSPPDQELIQMLGASVKLISKTGNSTPEDVDMQDTQDSSESEEEESDEDVSSDDDKGVRGQSLTSSSKGSDEWEKVDAKEARVKEEYKGKDGILKGKNVMGLGKERGKHKEGTQELTPRASEPPIAPIPIKQRTPTPSFSVTSRPPLVRSGAITSSGSGYTSVAPSTTASNGSLSSSSGGKTRQQGSSTMNPMDTHLSSSSGASAPATSEMRGRSMGPGAPPLRSPAMSRTSNQSGRDSPANTAQDSNRSSIADNPSGPSGGRQRSSTMMPSISVSAVPGMPARPFARRDSPASSTGDSSSGRAPLTPRDGSDIGSMAGSGIGAQAKSGESNSAMKGSSGLRSAKRRSVCFEDDLIGESAPHTSGRGKLAQKEGREGVDEEKRKERRRSEARAAIELGNVINGRGPIVDDEEEDVPINQTAQGRMSGMNPMMGMGGGIHPMQMGSMPSWNGPWGNPMGHQMYNTPQYMQGGPDPSVIAAHQQAMMIAKQAYQMAVAQQAAVAAGDEWERGSATGGFGGRGMFAGGMPNAPMGPPPYGMGPMGGMGMGGMSMGMGMPNMNMNMMGMGSNWSSAGSVGFPPSSRSMYGGGGGINSSRSEYGGSAGGGWNSARSTYGESFGPPTGRVPKPAMAERESRAPPVPPVPSQTQGRVRTTSQPNSTRSNGQKKAPPPSSWKGS